MSDPNTVPAPEQRVREFLDAFVRVWGDEQPIESVPGPGPESHRHFLDVSDVRDVLNELDSWRTAAERAGVTA